MGNYLSTSATIIGGIGLGALAMYLLDPDQGPDRREYLQKRAGKLIDSTADTIGSSGKTLRHTASSVADHLSSHASHLGHYADSAAKSARKYAHENMPSTRSHKGAAAGIVAGSAMALGVTAVGCGLIGAGLMFFMDPEIGGRRRHQVSDKLSAYLPNMGKSQHNHQGQHRGPIQEAAYPRSEVSQERTPSTEQL